MLYPRQPDPKEPHCECPNGVNLCHLVPGHGQRHVAYALATINGEKIQYTVTWWR